MRVLVLDVGGTYTKFALVEDFSIVWKNRISTPKDAFIQFIEQLAKEHRDIKGIVIGFPGIVSKDGIVLFSPHIPSIVGKSIKRISDIPIIIDNDANLFALGEYAINRGKYRNLIGITLGTGVGGGIVIEGKLYKGKGGAGEVGHMIIDIDGPKCDCGNYGCAEAFLGEAYFPERCSIWFERSGRKIKNLNGKILKQMADNGDVIAEKCWNWYGEKLAILISNLVNIFAPDAIPLGGGLSNAFDNFSPSMYQNLMLLLGKRYDDVYIYRSPSPEKSTFLGGFKLFIESQ